MDQTIYYVCKYTPVELLAGLGYQTERLDPMPASFACAEACSHPNLCGFGKAVLEEVLQKDIKRLFLVDCCDVCRRIYDVLKEKGDMEFLYLMGLPHKNGKAETNILTQELRKIKTGKEFDEVKALKEWEKNAVPDHRQYPPASYITLSGAHGGTLLKTMLEEHIALPVVDETCTGERKLEGSRDLWNLNEYAGSLLNQKSPCMRMQFRKNASVTDAAGIILHTVKFCDYYGFQYHNLREKKDRKLLKIETDCSMQSKGQIATRLDAFAETLGQKPRRKVLNEFRNVAGIDSGSSSTDVVILDRDLHIVASSILPTGAGAASGAEKALEEALDQAGIQKNDLDRIVTTGYGRDTIGISDKAITEITCHAKGAFFLDPDVRTIIDIGGQDSKVICVDETGTVINFVMNDKCAAGTGRFLEMMARTMQMSLEEMSRRGLKWKNDVTISSMCTVFAESEVVSLIAENAMPEDIIHGLNESVAGKTMSLVRRAGGKPAYMITGGVASNMGVVEGLEKKLGERIYVSDCAQLCGVLGAALIAAENIGRDYE